MRATQRRSRKGLRKTLRQVKQQDLLLQTFWTGNPLSRLERAALQSYVNQGYTVEVYTYNPIPTFMERVPASPHIRVHDAREILPESALFQYAGRAEIGKRQNAYSYLPFSDLFRFTMLHKKGGAWMDLDIFLTRPIPKKILDRPYVFSSERTIQKGAYRKAEPEIVDMGFIKVPGPGSELTQWILDHIPTSLLDLKTPFDYMNLFRKAVAACDLEKYVLPARAFLPLNWWDVKNSFAPGAGVPGVCYRGKYGVESFCVDELERTDVYGVHWFRAILRKKGLPYERVENREVVDNLYERMIRQIEAEGGLGWGTL
jgi:hypothetical protein